MTTPLTLQTFIDAKKRGLSIRHQRKGTLYNILCIGKSKDDNSGEWQHGITYSDGDEFYTRFLRDMGGFDIVAEDTIERLDTPKYYTVTFEMNSQNSFLAINKLCADSMQEYSLENPPLMGVVSASNANETVRLEMIEAIIESNTTDADHLLRKTISINDPQYSDLEALEKELLDSH